MRRFGAQATSYHIRIDLSYIASVFIELADLVKIAVYWWLGSRVIACLTQAQKGPGSNLSRDAVG